MTRVLSSALARHGTVIFSDRVVQRCLEKHTPSILSFFPVQRGAQLISTAHVCATSDSTRSKDADFGREPCTRVYIRCVKTQASGANSFSEKDEDFTINRRSEKLYKKKANSFRITNRNVFMRFLHFMQREICDVALSASLLLLFFFYNKFYTFLASF